MVTGRTNLPRLWPRPQRLLEISLITWDTVCRGDSAALVTTTSVEKSSTQPEASWKYKTVKDRMKGINVVPKQSVNVSTQQLIALMIWWPWTAHCAERASTSHYFFLHQTWPLKSVMNYCLFWALHVSFHSSTSKGRLWPLKASWTFGLISG